MSRTDKTRPWWVKAREHSVEHHNHTKGPCSIDRNARPGWSPDRCYVDADWSCAQFRCGCDWCKPEQRGQGRARQALRRLIALRGDE